MELPEEGKITLEQYREVKELVKDLKISKGNPKKNNWGSAVFLIGAGCSRSAGIPLASEIAQDCIIKLAKIYASKNFKNASKALTWLRNKGWVSPEFDLEKNHWGRLYGKIFEEHFKTAIDQREIILEAIGKSKGKINWTHLCLGELVRSGFIHTVLTTNFDQLVLQGIINAGLLPVVADGIESLTRVTSQPQKPQVVHLHGSMHTYNMLNSEKAVLETGRELPLGATLYRLLQDSKMLVVVGYSGGEEGVMKLLIEATKRFKDMVIYWIIYEDNHESLSDRATDLLKIGHNKFIIPGKSADKLFAEITEGLGIGAPEWMEKPINLQLNNLTNFADTDDSDIKEKIRDYKRKIEVLEDCWSNAEAKDLNWLNEVVTLRLKGKHEEALKILREHQDSNDPDVWRMRAESANEVGQSMSDRKHMEESIKAWKHILTIGTKTENPRSWYEAHKGLGQTLQSLGEIENNKKYLEQAITAYNEALQEIDKKKAKFDWAEIQHLLGITLQTIGDLKVDETILRDAIKAFRAALEIYTVNNDPRAWAETQVNLGDVLQTLGNLKNNKELLEQAVQAYNDALRVYTENSTLLDWAETQSHLGGALFLLGEQNSDVSFFEEAILVYQRALEAYRKTNETDLIPPVEKNINEAKEEIEKLKVS